MNSETLNLQLQRMLQDSPHVHACALVEAGSGLIWAHGGSHGNGEPLWEAAIEYWRLHQRNGQHFASLGPLGGAVLYHQQGLLVILPCLREPELLMVCVARSGVVDWREWRRHALSLGELIRANA